jgi:hypothetical protein
MTGFRYALNATTNWTRHVMTRFCATMNRRVRCCWNAIRMQCSSLRSIVIRRCSISIPNVWRRFSSRYQMMHCGCRYALNRSLFRVKPTGVYVPSFRHLWRCLVRVRRGATFSHRDRRLLRSRVRSTC